MIHAVQRAPPTSVRPHQPDHPTRIRLRQAIQLGGTSSTRREPDRDWSLECPCLLQRARGRRAVVAPGSATAVSRVRSSVRAVGVTRSTATSADSETADDEQPGILLCPAAAWIAPV